MSIQHTLDKLAKMRLTGMSEAFEEQWRTPQFHVNSF